MGNFLDTPKVDKETEVGSDAEKNISFGVSAMQGWRAQMEDDHLHLCRLHENVRTTPPSARRQSVRRICSPLHGHPLLARSLSLFACACLHT